MKKIIFTFLVTTICIASTCVISCKSSNEKVQDAKNNVAEAEENLIKAQQDSVTDYQEFKKQAAEKISTHEKSIAEFKARIANEKTEIKATYEKQLDELEHKNSDMKKSWMTIKKVEKNNGHPLNEFNNDMNELGQAFKRFTVNNKK